MPDLLDIPPFLDRRNQAKGTTVTDQPKPKKERKTVLRLVVEIDRKKFTMENAAALVAKAKELGTVTSAKLTGLPTSADLG